MITALKILFFIEASVCGFLGNSLSHKCLSPQVASYEPPNSRPAMSEDVEEILSSVAHTAEHCNLVLRYRVQG